MGDDLRRGPSQLPPQDSAALPARELRRDELVGYVQQRVGPGPCALAHALIAGVLQSLLLTRHVLSVGTSMLGDDLIRIAHQVRTALEGRADVDSRRSGTVLALQEDPVRARLSERDVDTVAMAGPEDPTRGDDGAGPGVAA